MNVVNKPEGVPVEKLNWIEVLVMIHELTEKIKASKEKFDYIYGIPRGGLIPAVILSHKLGIPLTRDLIGKYSCKDIMYLVVDDISDTGSTLMEAQNAHNRTATLHMRYNSTVLPNFYVKEIKDNTWIQYPWEAD